MLILAARRTLAPLRGLFWVDSSVSASRWGEDIGYYVSALEDGTGGQGKPSLIRRVLGGWAYDLHQVAYFLAWSAPARENAFVKFLQCVVVCRCRAPARAGNSGLPCARGLVEPHLRCSQILVTAVAIALLVWECVVIARWSMSALDWPVDADGCPHREAARVLL